MQAEVGVRCGLGGGIQVDDDGAEFVRDPAPLVRHRELLELRRRDVRVGAGREGAELRLEEPGVQHDPAPHRGQAVTPGGTLGHVHNPTGAARAA